MRLLKKIRTRFSPVLPRVASVSRVRRPEGHWRAPGIHCLAILALASVLAGCTRTSGPANGFGGDPKQGANLIQKFGCGTCHTIPGIADADGEVGPPLNAMGRRVYIAGKLRNSPGNMVSWLKDPQAVVPGNAMPDMGISQEEARDIAAYLYTLK